MAEQRTLYVAGLGLPRAVSFLRPEDPVPLGRRVAACFGGRAKLVGVLLFAGPDIRLVPAEAPCLIPQTRSIIDTPWLVPRLSCWGLVLGDGPRPTGSTRLSKG